MKRLFIIALILSGYASFAQHTHLTAGRIPFTRSRIGFDDNHDLAWNDTTSTLRVKNLNVTTGIIGTSTNDNASSGNIGEFVSSSISVGSAVSLTTATAANVTSISLTAGDWDVSGMVSFNETTSTVTARTAGISSTSATLPTDGSEGYCGVQSNLTSEINSITLPVKRISIASTTTIYLVCKATFSAGTCGGFGTISARRVR